MIDATTAVDLMTLHRRIEALEEYIYSVHRGAELPIDTELVDGQQSGRFSDFFDHAENAITTHARRALVRKTIDSHDMDATGRVGSYHTFVVQDSNGDWLAVSGWVF